MNNQPCPNSCRYLLLLTAVLAVFSTISGSSWAVEPGCNRAAESWISELSSTKSDILHSHSLAKCAFSGKWLIEYEHAADADSRRRMCTDLVLIWTHKECIYFRDYIDPEAYTPCKDWTRQMFQHCMDNNLTWFSAATGKHQRQPAP